MDGKPRVFMLGGYTGHFKSPLRKRGIKVERILDAACPFALVGETDDSMQKYLEECDDVPTITMIKKNFSNLLSRNPEKYESNYKKQPYGKSVDYSNNTDYLLIYFTSVTDLWKVGNAIYSQTYPTNSFCKAIQKGEKIPIPFPRYFDWKSYIEEFAQICLENYDRYHIILIRSHISSYYIGQNAIRNRKESIVNLRNQTYMVENYFMELTNCQLVTDFYDYVSDGETDPSPFKMPEDAFDRASDTIREIIFKKDLPNHTREREIVPSIDQRISTYKQNLLKKYTGHELKDRIPKELQFFLDEKHPCMLSDYVRERNLDAKDIKIIERYMEWLKLSMDDVITMFLLWRQMKENGTSDQLEHAIGNMCANSDCYPIQSMRRFIRSNLEYLSKYPWLDEELQGWIHSLKEIWKETVFRLGNQFYFRINPDGPVDFEIFEWKENIANFETVIESHYVCSIFDLNSLSRSWDFYIRKARSGCGNTPVCVEFASVDEFAKSLFCVDYKKILESENSILCIKKNMQEVRDKLGRNYTAKCNLSILFRDDVKIVHIRDGLGDQIRYYVLSRYIQDKTGATILYDDLLIQKKDAFNGLEFDKVANEDKRDLRSRFLSCIVSKQLQEAYQDERDILLLDFLYEHGCDNIVGVVEANRANNNKGERRGNCFNIGIEREDVNLALGQQFCYYYVLTSPEKILDHFSDYHRYISLPEIADEKNRDVANEMLSCDAVAIHIRLGDMWAIRSQYAKPKFFYHSLKKLKEIPDYPNKKYYVFSDDINYVQMHKRDFGLELVDSADIRYITHNKNDDSFWDIKLISLAKIIIGSFSGFSRMGAMASERKEIYVCQSAGINHDMERVGWKNKYDLQRGSLNYKFIATSVASDSGWDTIFEKKNIELQPKEFNYNHYTYPLPQDHGIYSVQLSEVQSDCSEFTAGLYDSNFEEILQFKTFSVANGCIFNFSVNEDVEGLVFCFYAGRHGKTKGHWLHAGKFSVKFNKLREK